MLNCTKIQIMKKAQDTCLSRRILTELEYAVQVSIANENAFDSCIRAGMDYVYEYFTKYGSITEESVAACEKILLPVQESAKRYNISCVAHAHIDMNWMWSYNETVAITLDTFRTVLMLMKEYPQLTFSQSQASVYRIVEENDPIMFEEIKERVREGRWEITASTWVEADKNMPDGESQARHILYTKRYFHEKFGIDASGLQLDFEPDTFGHNASVPEILSKGNVKYYYHCRGYQQHDIYNWKAKSGEQILVYKEPFWYNAQITPDFILPYPQACRKNNTDRMLKVYGVGDHGGGPTRRDIENLIDMAGWPISPTLEFSTYRAFYQKLETQREHFPTVEGELNYVFTGCYSSQSRLKMANRSIENSLFVSENVHALAKEFCKGADYSPNFTKAWERTLFNQFHDILTGSGVRETREHAMGNFQEAMGYAYGAKAASFAKIAEQIDTSSIPASYDKTSFSEGGGVGFKGNANLNSSITGGFDVLLPETGNGSVRILHLFNATQFTREEPVEITLWDYDADSDEIQILDVNGAELRHAVLEKGEFWAHRFIRMILYAKVEPFGYSTCIVRRNPEYFPAMPKGREPRMEYYEENLLENEWIKARFDPSMNLVELTDKTSGERVIRQKSAFFKLVIQNHQCETVMPGNAWVEGYPVKEVSLNDTECVHILERKNIDALRQSITYSIRFNQSTIRTTVSLDANSRYLKYSMDCDWHEPFDEKSGIPALKFSVPFHYTAQTYSYKIPFGTIERPSVNHDVPAIGFGFANRSTTDGHPHDRGLGLMADSVYAYRGENNALELTLVRSSQAPDPCPETGVIQKQIGITLCENDNRCFYEILSGFNHPVISFPNRSHKGTLPMTYSFLHVDGDFQVSAIKLPEDTKDGLILRVFEIAQKRSAGRITFTEKIKTADCRDIMEQPLEKKIGISDRELTFELSSNELMTLLVTFEKG